MHGENHIKLINGNVSVVANWFSYSWFQTSAVFRFRNVGV